MATASSSSSLLLPWGEAALFSSFSLHLPLRHILLIDFSCPLRPLLPLLLLLLLHPLLLLLLKLLEEIGSQP